jgi:hypothetical protein
MTGAPVPPAPEHVDADLIRARTNQLIAQSLLLVGELRTRTRQLEDLVADLTRNTGPAQGDDIHA